MNSILRKAVVITFIATSFLFGQNKDPFEILEKVKNKFEKISDYEVNVSIIVDVDLLKVPESKAKIYYKKPDKVKMESEGFAMLPKQGMNFSPAKLLSFDYSAIYVRSEMVDNHNTDVIKVIPNSDSAQVILSTFWIDPEHSVIRKIESTTKTSGTISISLNYDDKTNLPLPSEVTFSFNIANMQLPAAISGELGNDEEHGGMHGDRKKRKPISGTVTVKYENYKINIGLKDSFFEEKKDKN